MIRSLVIACALLLSSPTPALAQESPESAHSASAHGALAAIATVVEHTLDVVVDSNGRLRETRVWKVRFDDPARASEVRAPRWLGDVSTKSGAHIVDGRIALPDDFEPGQVVHFTAKRSVRYGPFSGAFEGADGLNSDGMRVTIQAPSWLSLHVWADRSGVPVYSRRRGRAVTYTWSPSAVHPRVEWSTFKNWGNVDERFTKAVDKKLRGSEAVHFGNGSAAQIAQAVYEGTPWNGVSGTFADARPIKAIRAEGVPSTAAERALVLIAALRTAGIDANPATFRPARFREQPPVSMPSISTLSQPLVVVESQGESLYFDPASPYSAFPSRPVSLYGAMVWNLGDVPVLLRDNAVRNGTIDVKTSFDVDAAGNIRFTSEITASGIAEEWLHSRLTPLSASERTTLMRSFVSASHPTVADFVFEGTGLGDPSSPLRLTMQGSEMGILAPMGKGLRGDLRPMAGPALAGWLPPQITVREHIAVQPPEEMAPLTLLPAERRYHPDVLYTHRHRLDGDTLVVTTTVERAAGQGTDAERFLSEQAKVGPELLLFGAANGRVVRSVRRSEFGGGELERHLTEAMLWFAIDNEKKAGRAILRAVDRSDVPTVASLLRQFARQDDTRPWHTLWRQAIGGDEKLAVIEGLEQHGGRREAWRLATRLVNESNNTMRVAALVAVTRLQGPQPNKREDPEGHSAWKDPRKLLKIAYKLEQGLPGADSAGDVTVVAPYAEQLLLAGRIAQASGLIGPHETPYALALKAELSALAGLPPDDVESAVHLALADAENNSNVYGICARAMAHLGRGAQALELGLTAARLDPVNPARWLAVHDFAQGAGELDAAFVAIQRASDIDPSWREAAIHYQRTAGLIRDDASAGIASERSKYPVDLTPYPVGTLVELAPAGGTLGILDAYDAEVVADQALLERRLDEWQRNGNRDRVFRDLFLLTKHHRVDGTAAAFAASVGRHWSTGALAELGRVTRRNTNARLARMEFALITTNGDAVSDARVLRSKDHRAKLVSLASYRASEVAAAVPDWPHDLHDPDVKTPTGLRSNWLLSAIRGVRAFSERDGEFALLYTNQSSGVLPPVLGAIYTLSPHAISRTPHGDPVYRLNGGALVLYAALTSEKGWDVWGVGFTPAGASRALDRSELE